MCYMYVHIYRVRMYDVYIVCENIQLHVMIYINVHCLLVWVRCSFWPLCTSALSTSASQILRGISSLSGWALFWEWSRHRRNSRRSSRQFFRWKENLEGMYSNSHPEKEAALLPRLLQAFRHGGIKYGCSILLNPFKRQSSSSAPSLVLLSPSQVSIVGK